MKVFGYAATIVWLTMNLAACGEDRTGEFIELTADTHWIYDVMDENYLWYDEMPAIDSYNSYFQDSEKFFKSLLAKHDRFSYMEVHEEENPTRAASSSLSYGFDFALYADPVTGSSSQCFARVLYVFPNSPAEESGLKRGDWISAVGETRITEKNYSMLLSGGATTFTLSTLNYLNPDSLYWESEVQCIPVSAARFVDENPFLVDSLYQIEGHRIAYLMYNSFSTGPENNPADQEYNNQMRQIFSAYKKHNPTDFILDLRYNPGGYLSCAQVLASLLAPQEAFGKVFCSLEFNDKQSAQRESLLFSQAVAGSGWLGLNKIYVIVGEQTASASESVINGLIPFMGQENVVLVGMQTVGKNVASISYESAEYGLTLHPIVATVYNGAGQSDYANGFTPYYEIDEFMFVDDYKPLGNTDEILLNSVLYMILNGDEIIDQNSTRMSFMRMNPICNSLAVRHSYETLLDGILN